MFWGAKHSLQQKYRSVCLTLSVSHSTCLSILICVSVCLSSFCLSVWLSVCLYISYLRAKKATACLLPNTCLGFVCADCVSLSVLILSVYLSVGRSVGLVCLPDCLSVSTFLSLELKRPLHVSSPTHVLDLQPNYLPSLKAASWVSHGTSSAVPLLLMTTSASPGCFLCLLCKLWCTPLLHGKLRAR